MNSVRALARPSLRHRRAEAALLLLHFATYLGIVLLVLSLARAIVFIELHLGLFGVYLGRTFAPMPTPNLRRPAPIVRDYCTRIGVAYTDAGPVDSYRQALRHPHAAGAPLRRRRGTDPEQAPAAAPP